MCQESGFTLAYTWNHLAAHPASTSRCHGSRYQG
jgi:hypothetical protein